MARVKEFDREVAVQAAITAFAAHGYEGTSTDELLRAMQIGRQSLYDTFGDKRQLYLAALKAYATASVAEMVVLLEAGPTPLGGIAAVLLDFAQNPRRLGASSCLGVSSVCEFGRSDADITAINDECARILEKALERQVKAGIEAGEIAGSLNPREVARYVLTTLTGMKVGAAGGESPAHLVTIARLALRAIEK